MSNFKKKHIDNFFGTKTEFFVNFLIRHISRRHSLVLAQVYFAENDPSDLENKAVFALNSTENVFHYLKHGNEWDRFSYIILDVANESVATNDGKFSREINEAQKIKTAKAAINFLFQNITKVSFDSLAICILIERPFDILPDCVFIKPLGSTIEETTIH